MKWGRRKEKILEQNLTPRSFYLFIDPGWVQTPQKKKEISFFNFRLSVGYCLVFLFSSAAAFDNNRQPDVAKC